MRWMVYLALVLINSLVWADAADLFFDDTQVQEIHLTFDNPNWLDMLIQGHAQDPCDPYFSATFQYQETVMDEIGVRFRGSSSFDAAGNKKPIKIDFQAYHGKSFLGLDGLILSNCYNDPTCLREKLFWDIAGEFGPAVRAVHTRVYVNGTYLGLYLAMDLVDKDFAQRYFGQQEDGNLFEALSNTEYPADMTWQGDDPAVYHESFALKINEGKDDYSQLIGMLGILNNTDLNNLPESLEPVLDVNQVLDTLALNNLMTNLDSYVGSADHYYLYRRDDTGRFVQFSADGDQAFGRAVDLLGVGLAPAQLPPLWLPTNGAGTETLARPLAQRLWAVEAYRQRYLQRLSLMLRKAFDEETITARVEDLANLIYDDLDADQNKFFSMDDFERNLTDNLTTANGTIPGLLSFVNERRASLSDQLNAYARSSDLQFSEVLSLNVTSGVDESGEHDPWVELANPGPGLLNLAGLGLSDDANDPLKWTLPDVNLDDGEFLVVWLDAEPQEGDLHTNFALPAAGRSLVLSDANGVIFDRIEVPVLSADQSYGRVDGVKRMLDYSTPGAANVWTYQPPHLYINELMADNKTTIEDPDQAGAFEDWVELYNGEDVDVDLSGMYLTDDPKTPTQWEIPQGVTIPAHGHLVFWLDNDTKQGDLHANFKLNRDGEAVGLYDTNKHNNQVINLIEFTEQTPDVSFGRNGDGVLEWRFMDHPTPGTANEVQ